jgi:hypothetical protein
MPMLQMVANARKQTSIARLDKATSEIRFQASRPTCTQYRPYLVKSRRRFVDQPRARDYGSTTVVPP